ncbi:Hpt domain protein [Synechococcus sp. PCC 7335]|uniref:Hpt domain-containing protein n=1 Tax=Synechococcus sp. (strain ATCC 29403 / PCC 7335) TaxID=91464 RepID=UPI00017EB4AD|nr:Hpt domain-containing protein [Synechococcus sp. PCC 7335]EDX87533.1 Hpt domain protein [Synechococcus sp. PCC 7335]
MLKAHGRQDYTDTLSTETLSTEFDWQQLQQLAGGDAEFEAELLAMFLNDARNSLRLLEGAIASKKLETIESVAHSLRGASANVGASAIANTAFELEHAARAGKTFSAFGLVREIDSYCQKIQAQLQAQI